MSIGIGIFLVAVGAVLAFAVRVTSGAIDLHTVGWILMIVGAAGIMLGLALWSTWAGPGYFARRGDAGVVSETRRTTIDEVG